MAIVVLNLAATEISGNNIAYSFKQAGGTVVGIQAVSPTLPDYSTVVQTAIQQGADCISQVMGGSMEAELIRAVASSSKPSMTVEGGSDFTASEFSSLKKYMNGSISTSASYFLPVDETAGVPAGGLGAFVDAMNKYEPGTPQDMSSLQGWQGMTLFIAAAEKATTVNAHTVAAAMATISGMHLSGVPVPVSFTTPNSNPKIARVFDTQDAVYKLENGKWNYVGLVDFGSDLAGFLNSSGSNVG